MKSSSIKPLLAHYPDISARDYRDNLIHEWHISTSYKNILQVFETKKILTSVLNKHIHDGVIFYKGGSYNITWLSGPRSVNNSPVAILSFRYCVLLNTGYVLIKTYVEDGIENNITFANDWDFDNGN